MVPRALGPLIAVALWLAACGGSGDGAASRPKAPRPATTIQPSGVYPYDTRGFERLSAVFASRHDYPRESTVDVERGRCGFSERWQPRPERWSEWRYCVAGSRWRIETLLDYHEFFGQAVRQQFACRGPFVPRPTTVAVGFRWTDRCRGAGSRVTVRYRALRDETVSAGGKRVQTVLVRAEAKLRGRIDGVNVIDSWLSRVNGLLVRRAVTSATAIASPFGKLRDGERYSLQIRSLHPR